MTAANDVLGDVCDILHEVLELEPGTLELSAMMSLTDEVGLESIDLVNVGALLADRFGPEVNLAAHLAELEMDDVIALTVGSLVEFVVAAVAGAPEG